jgi:glycosyltransferase involved in cell wall biosynthesis
MDGVSYIVTVYNKAPFLPLVLGAIFDQRGAFEREVVIVDDGSTDDSFEICRRLAEGRNDVTLIRQANAGPARATNVGVAASRMPWLKIVDADDVLAPRCTELLLRAVRETGAGAAFGRTGDYELGKPVPFPPDDPADAAPPPAIGAANVFRRFLKNVPCNLSPTLIAVSSYREVGGCDERIFTQDYSLLLRLSWACRFAEVDALVCFSPVEAPGRVSANQMRMLQDTNLALFYFLSETEGIASSDRRFAMDRALGRAWKWQRRRLGKSHLSRFFWLYLLARAVPPRWQRPLLASTLAAFKPPTR